MQCLQPGRAGPQHPGQGIPSPPPVPKKLPFFGRFSGRARVRISNTILAKVDIFGNAKKVSAEIMKLILRGASCVSGFRIGF